MIAPTARGSTPSEVILKPLLLLCDATYAASGQLLAFAGLSTPAVWRQYSEAERTASIHYARRHSERSPPNTGWRLEPRLPVARAATKPATQAPPLLVPGHVGAGLPALTS